MRRDYNIHKWVNRNGTSKGTISDAISGQHINIILKLILRMILKRKNLIRQTPGQKSNYKITNRCKKNSVLVLAQYI